jgi:ABC-type proline/glycine betaine transport system permease subunit
MKKREFLFPAVMIALIIGIPIGIVLWVNFTFL